jgi:hypothetical protein
MYRLPPGDFPDLERFKETLKDHDFDTFAKLDEKLVNRIDEVLGIYLPRSPSHLLALQLRTQLPTINGAQVSTFPG